MYYNISTVYEGIPKLKVILPSSIHACTDYFWWKNVLKHKSYTVKWPVNQEKCFICHQFLCASESKVRRDDWSSYFSTFPIRSTVFIFSYCISYLFVDQTFIKHKKTDEVGEITFTSKKDNLRLCTVRAEIQDPTYMWNN